MTALLETPTSTPSSSNAIHIKKFLTAGNAPFSELSFVTHQVFELTKPFKSKEEMENYHELLSLVISFELWLIPSIFNAKKMFRNMEKQKGNVDQFLFTLQKNLGAFTHIPTERLFVVVNRQEARTIAEQLTSLDIPFLEIPEKVAQVIKVKYPKEGENSHETISV